MRYRLEHTTIHSSATLDLGPDDKVFYEGAHGNGQWGVRHTFMILRAEPETEDIDDGAH